MRTIVLLGLVGLSFSMGVLVTRAQSTQVTMRGIVKDANTLPEEIQYWEIREREGVSISIAGARNLPLIAWLRNAKERRIVVTIARDESAPSPQAARDW